MTFNVYKMRLDPGDADEGTDPFEFCKDEEVIGVGHRIYADRSYETLDQVKQAHWEYEAEYYDPNNRSRFNNDETLDHELSYILEDMEEGDYVWVNRGNRYALCRVSGDWEVMPNVSQEDRERYDAHDIQNFREAEWSEIPYFAVPGFVRSHFSGPFGTIKRMRTGVNHSTRDLIERLFEQDEYDQRDKFNLDAIEAYIDEATTQELTDLLGPIGTEDLVLLYLQSNGWKLVGSSMSKNQAEIECEMHRGDEVGYVQVKSGNATIDPSDFEDYEGTVYLFAGDDMDLGSYESICQISADDVFTYLRENTEEAPHEVLSEIEAVITEQSPVTN